MRYLFTFDASKPRGGVKFEPVTRVGGQLFGTVALEDNLSAETVLREGHPFVKEITKEDYDLYQNKKKFLIASKNSFSVQDNNQGQLPDAKPAAKAPLSKLSAASPVDILKPSKVK